MAITNATLAQQISDLIEHWSSFNEEYANWVGGAVDGGPNSDGRYPLTDYQGVERLSKSPARLEQDVSGQVSSASAHATAAAASASSASTSATTAAAQAVAAGGFKDTAVAEAGKSAASASAAATSEANALAFRNTASAHKSAAGTSATNAATSETNAATSETNAAASASAAATSATQAATFTPSLYAALADTETITGPWTFTQNLISNKAVVAKGNENPTGQAVRLSVVSGTGYLDSRDFTGATWEPLIIRADTVDVQTSLSAAGLNLPSGDLDLVGLRALNKSGNWLYINGSNEFASGVYVGSSLQVAKQITGVGGKEAIRMDDNWLRLNNLQNFSNGVYTPGDLRVDDDLYTLSDGSNDDSLYRYLKSPLALTSADRIGTFGWQYTQVSTTADNWYTIATDPDGLDITAAPPASGGSRAESEFIITDIDSGKHSFIAFQVSQHYGRRPAITVLNASSYGALCGIVKSIRVVSSTTYDGHAVQALAGHSGIMRIYKRDRMHNGFRLRNPPVAQVPNASWALHELDLTAYSDQVLFAIGGDGTGGSDTEFGRFVVTPSGTHVAGESIGKFEKVTGDYGSVQVSGAEGAISSSWEGYSIGGQYVFIGSLSASACGIFNDADNEWMVRCVRNGNIILYDNGVEKFRTLNTGIRSLGTIQINNASTYIREGSSGNQVRLGTDSGYVDIGPRNTSWCHFVTDRSNFYFNKSAHVNGSLIRYLQGAYPYYADSTYTGGKITVSSTAPSSPTKGDIWFDTT